MIVLHVVVAVLFAVSGLGYGLSLGLPIGHVGGLYGLCGALGLALSIVLRLACVDMSVRARKRAQGGLRWPGKLCCDPTRANRQG